MRHASKIGYIFLFGIPAFLIPGSLWWIGESAYATLVALIIFVVAVGAWAFATSRLEEPEIARGCLGAAIGSAYGMGMSMAAQAFFGI